MRCWKLSQYCSNHGIGCFRINSQILPIKTHPEVGYDLGDLPGGEQIVDQFRRCGEFARANRLRTTFHPDQFHDFINVRDFPQCWPCTCVAVME